MKLFLLLGVSIMAVSACAPEPTPPSAAGSVSAVQPDGNPTGSPTNATTYFDGIYTEGVIQNASTGKSLSECPNLAVAGPVTVRKGLAQLQVNNGRVNSTFQGYVSPDGTLAMKSEIGQTFQGRIDSNYVLKARTVGNCVYDAVWKRTSLGTAHF